MYPYQPIDFIISAIVIIGFLAFLFMTRNWSDRDYRNRFFTADEEARFFHMTEDEVEEARSNGRQ